MKVSFDFDSTLELLPIQSYAEELIKRGVEVWVVTSRFGDDELYKRFFQTSTNVDLTNSDLKRITDRLGIPSERIYFTNMKDKWEFFENKGFIWHLDDDWVENEMINARTMTVGIDCFSNPHWKEDCEGLLKRSL